MFFFILFPELRDTVGMDYTFMYVMHISHAQHTYMHISLKSSVHFVE